MKKSLLCLLVLSLTLSFASCASKNPPEEIIPEDPATVEEIEEEEEAEPISEEAIMEINIFHLGVRTALDKNEEQVMAMARKLLTLLENAATTDSMEASPETVLNPMQVMTGHTALELKYANKVELPLTLDGQPLTARSLLFYVPISSSEGALLYIVNELLSSSEGALLYIVNELYDETPLGRFFDQALQNDISNRASDQVERVVFSADGKDVLINGETYQYKRGEDLDELNDRLLNRMLYRAIAFCLNSYTGNVNGLQDMSTNVLYEAVLKAHDGTDTRYGLGEEIIANFSKYALTLPQSITAPLLQDEDDNYQVFLQLNERMTVEIDFVVEEDMPLVTSLQIIMLDEDEEAE